MKKQCDGQLNIFDFLNESKIENLESQTQTYKVGEYIKHHGRLITTEDLQKKKIRINDLIVIDCSTESTEFYKVGRVLDFFQRLRGDRWRVVCKDGTKSPALCDIGGNQMYGRSLHTSVFCRLYFLPPDEIEWGQSIKDIRPAAIVHTCSKCGEEVYRAIRNPKNDIVTLNLSNCRRCGCVII